MPIMNHFYNLKFMKFKNLLFLGLIVLCSFGAKAQTVSSTGDYLGNVSLDITGVTGITQIDWYNGASIVASVVPDPLSGNITTTYTPSTVGTYSASVTTAGGTNTTNSVVVAAIPDPVVTVNSTTPGAGVQYGGCFTGNSFTFGVSNLSSSFVYSWDFGDGNTSAIAAPTHQYTSSGLFKVHLIITDAAVVTSTDQWINVYPTATAAYNVLSPTVNGNAYTFISSSTVASGYIASYLWNFGDGTTSTLSNPSHVYATAGVKTVGLTITTDQGCTSNYTASQNIVLTGTAAYAAFTVNNAAQCLTTGGSSNSFTFTNNLTGSGVTYSWDFGDGNTSNGQATASNSYANAGSYTVTLTATVGSSSTTYSQTVNVYPNPVASYGVYAGTVTGNYYTFISSSTIASGYIASYAWDFGDHTGTDVVSNPSYIYGAVGSYTVTLVTTSDMGCASIYSAVQNITLTSVTPATAFSVNHAGQCVSTKGTANSFIFTNALSQGAGISYSWDFGDGTSDLTHFVTASHTYTNAGTYTVVLTATVGGSSSTYSQTVTVYPMPTPSYYLLLNTVGTPLNPDLHICFSPGLDFSWIENSTIQSGNMLYTWSYGTTNYFDRNGNATSSTNPRIVFNAAGTYPVKLVVTSDHGCQDSTTHVIYLSEPHAVFSSLVDNGGDQTVNPYITLTGTSSYDPGGTLVDYAWTYENGTHANGPAMTGIGPIKFAKGGIYNNHLQVTSDAGCVNSVAHQITFYIQPVGLFTLGSLSWSNSTGRPSVSVATNTSTVDETPKTLTYSWNFGDGTGSSASSSHTYTVGAATRVVTLTVTNTNGGLTNTYTQSLSNVYIQPKAAFSQSQTSSASAALQVTFNSGASTTHESGTTLSYDWDFGDGTAHSNTANPTHNYASGGTYTATLTVANSNGGMTSTVSHSFTYYVTPVASFSATKTSSATAQIAVDFDAAASSINDATATLSYDWNFGDGSAHGSGVTTSHSYTSGGAHTVLLTVTSNHGNVTATNSQVLTYYVTPVASFSATKTSSATAQLSVDFDASASSINDATATLSYDWDFGDGSAHGSGVTTSHSYTSGGAHTVVLTVTSNHGSVQATSSQSVTFYVTPVASYSASEDVNAVAQFDAAASSINDATATLSYDWDFGDATAHATGITTSHTYAAAGTYTVVLTVTSNHGSTTDVYSHSYTYYAKPTAAFTSNVNYGGDLYSNPTVEFDASTTNAHDGSASLTYDWNFGDATVHGSGATPSHTYTTGGTKTVTLIVTNANGGYSHQVSHNVDVVITPKAVINVGNTSGDDGSGNFDLVIGAFTNPVLGGFTNSSIATGTIDSYSWSFDYTDNIGSTFVPNYATQTDGPSAGVNSNFTLHIPAADVTADFTITAHVTATSDLGVAGSTVDATININGLSLGSGSGYSSYKNGNHPAVTVIPVSIPRSISLYPNPAMDDATISFKAASEKTVLLVYDQSGKLLKQVSVATKTNNITKYTFSVAGLVRGTYNVIVADQNGKRVGTTKFVKAN